MYGRRSEEKTGKDIDYGVRTGDVIDRSIARLPLYRELDTIMIETGGRTVFEIADEIAAL